MPLTSHAIRSTVGLSAVVILVLSFGTGQAAPQILDLTKQPRAKNRSMGVPGGAVTGMGGEPKKKGYELPLRLNMERFLVKGDSLTIDLKLTNTGGIPVNIPACVDSHKAFPPGAVGRRVLNLGLLFEGPKKGIDQIVDVIFSSSSTPECSVILDPQRSLSIIDAVQVPTEALDGSVVSVKAFLEEWKIEDVRYFIRERSQRPESEAISIGADPRMHDNE
jgi:hypothetical protein